MSKVSCAAAVKHVSAALRIGRGLNWYSPQFSQSETRQCGFANRAQLNWIQRKSLYTKAVYEYTINIL